MWQHSQKTRRIQQPVFGASDKPEQHQYRPDHELAVDAWGLLPRRASGGLQVWEVRESRRSHSASARSTAASVDSSFEKVPIPGNKDWTWNRHCLWWRAAAQDRAKNKVKKKLILETKMASFYFY